MHAKPRLDSFYLVAVACTVRVSSIMPVIYAFLSDNFSHGMSASHYYTPSSLNRKSQRGLSFAKSKSPFAISFSKIAILVGSFASLGSAAVTALRMVYCDFRARFMLVRPVRTNAS